MRTVLTEEKDTAAYMPASLETANLATERLYYSGVDTGRVNKSSVSGYPADGYTSPNDYVQQLSGSGYKIGPGIVLKVMAGDQFNIRVSSWYKKNGATPGTPNSPLPALINALINSIGNVTAAAHGATAAQLQSSGVLIPGASGFYSSHNTADSTTKPKAFVNWVLLDDQFKYVATGSGFEQVGADQEFKIHVKSNMPVTKNGYLYVYVSNETPNINVFFDNLQVTHITGPLLQEQSYYPFGLQMAGISDAALGKLNSENKFNGGVELEEDYGVNLYSTFYRRYDPQIGRFGGVDILSEQSINVSGYQFALNDPIRMNDPFGSKQTPTGNGGGDYMSEWDDIYNTLYYGDGGYGGKWLPNQNASGGGGGYSFFSSDAEAFGYGASYMTSNNLWGSQTGWAGSFSEAYSNFSAASSSGGKKGYNYATADFSSIYFYKDKYHGDVEYFSGPTGGANYYFSGYGNVDDFNAIQEGYKLQQSHADLEGMADAALGFVGGALELTSGAALEFISGGTLTPFAAALTVDAGARMWGNAGKFVAAASGNTQLANAIPANIGAALGKGIDMATGKSIYDYGYGQAIGGSINDVATLISTGGTIGAMAELQESPSILGASRVGLAGPTFIYTTVSGFISLSENN